MVSTSSSIRKVIFKIMFRYLVEKKIDSNIQRIIIKGCKNLLDMNVSLQNYLSQTITFQTPTYIY